MTGDLNRFFIDILNTNLSVRFDAIAAIESTCISLYTSTHQILRTDHSSEPFIFKKRLFLRNRPICDSLSLKSAYFVDEIKGK